MLPADHWFVCCVGWVESAPNETEARNEVDRLNSAAMPCQYKHLALMAPDHMTAKDRYLEVINGH